MKANLPKADHKKGPYHGYELQLTIGMIVKNEEETLERCLSSMKPLLDAVSSELIITDTGSTDRTVEIAQQFTDHIQHFEWCGDFAAARNAALKEARGEWFMFIDADEWFEDISEIIAFFQSGEYQKYNYATYVVRNYFDRSGNGYQNSYASRLFRCYPDIKFEGLIHEGILPIPPCKIFTCFVHHYGYAYRTKEEERQKLKRNEELLKKAILKDPTDLKSYYQLGYQYITENKYDEAEKVNRKGLEEEKKHLNRTRRLALQNALLICYVQQKEYRKVLNTLGDFHLEKEVQEIYFLDSYFIGQLAAFSLKDYGKAVEMGKSYLSLYRDYRENKLDPTALMNAAMQHIEETDKEFVLYLQGKAYLLLEEREKAISCLDSMDISLIQGKSDLYSLSLFLSSHFHDWSICTGFYRRILKLHNKQKTKDWETFLENYLRQHPEDHLAAIEALAGLEGDNTYLLLCRLRHAEETDNRQKAQKYLDQLIDRADEWNVEVADALYYGIRESVDLQSVVDRMPAGNLKVCLSVISTERTDLMDLIPTYIECHSFSGLKGLFWTVTLKETVVLLWGKEEVVNQKKLHFMEEFINQLSQYVHSVYQERVLEETNLSLLPDEHQFGYYMGKVFEAKGREDGVACFSYLHRALESYPVMKESVRILMDRFQKEEEQRQKREKEFSVLAVQAKQQVNQMLAAGKKEQARSVLSQLKKLLPNDPDIVRLGQQIT